MSSALVKELQSSDFHLLVVQDNGLWLVSRAVRMVFGPTSVWLRKAQWVWHGFRQDGPLRHWPWEHPGRHSVPKMPRAGWPLITPTAQRFQNRCWHYCKCFPVSPKLFVYLLYKTINSVQRCRVNHPQEIYSLNHYMKSHLCKHRILCQHLFFILCMV
jgi:hypothetical protein